MHRTAYYIIILALMLAGCNSKRKITLSTNLNGSVWHRNGELIAETMAKYDWQINVLYGPEYATEKARELVENREVDFAIIPNNRVLSQGNIRAVAPLNQEAMLILYRDDGVEYKSLKKLVKGKTLLMPVQGSGTAGLIDEVFSTLEIGSDDYSIYNLDLQNLEFISGAWKKELDSIEVLITFSQLNNPLIKEIINSGWNLFKLGDFSNLNQGSLIDALCLKYPWAFPIIIPKKVFGNLQPEPIYTLGIQSLLITHKDTDHDLIYNFLTDFYTSLPAMSQKNVAFAQITENYNRASISYPMHDGTIRYMNRDNPSFLERYAELLALLITIGVLSAGIINRYVHKLNQDKKDFIDVYYDELLAAKSKIELEDIRLRAVYQMQEDNLRADDSFVIFLQLFEQRRNELTEEQ